MYINHLIVKNKHANYFIREKKCSTFLKNITKKRGVLELSYLMTAYLKKSSNRQEAMFFVSSTRFFLDAKKNKLLDNYIWCTRKYKHFTVVTFEYFPYIFLMWTNYLKSSFIFCNYCKMLQYRIKSHFFVKTLIKSRNSLLHFSIYSDIYIYFL